MCTTVRPEKQLTQTAAGALAGAAEPCVHAVSRTLPISRPGLSRRSSAPANRERSPPMATAAAKQQRGVSSPAAAVAATETWPTSTHGRQQPWRRRRRRRRQSSRCMDVVAPPPHPAAAPCGGRHQSAMRTAAFSLLLHLLCSCSPLWWPLAGGVVPNRTEDLPIVFPDDNVATTSSRTVRRLPDPRPVRNGIPESLLFRMRGVQNLTDFVSQFLEGYPDATAVDGFEGPPSILGKKGPVGGSSASLPNPEPGTCLPSKQLVEFPKPTDPSIILWPPCTRIPRCGGCCPSTILKCAPTKTSNVTFKVIKAQYPEPGASKFNFVGHEVVTLEKHDKCSCECKERPSDCNALQEYTECRCVCRNNHEMATCNGASMVWDHRDCRCKCRDYAECSTGFYFNTRTCRCESLGGRARIASRILQPLPKLYAPYTDNRENVQSRSYRNLDLVAADDYSRPYTDVEHAVPVRRDLSAKTTTTATESDSTTGQTVPASTSMLPRSTHGPGTPTQRLSTAATSSSSAPTVISRSRV